MRKLYSVEYDDVQRKSSQIVASKTDVSVTGPGMSGLLGQEYDSTEWCFSCEGQEILMNAMNERDIRELSEIQFGIQYGMRKVNMKLLVT